MTTNYRRCDEIRHFDKEALEMGDDDDCDMEPRDECERCGGDGFIELAEAPELWGEDCMSEKNRLVKCPDCDGYGFFK